MNTAPRLGFTTSLDSNNLRNSTSGLLPTENITNCCKSLSRLALVATAELKAAAQHVTVPATFASTNTTPNRAPSADVMAKQRTMQRPHTPVLQQPAITTSQSTRNLQNLHIQRPLLRRSHRTNQKTPAVRNMGRHNTTTTRTNRRPQRFQLVRPRKMVVT